MIKLKSTLKDFIWGGTKIRDVLGKDTGSMKRISESWEVSTHPEGMSIVASGQYAGKTLGEYFDAVGWEKAGDFARKNRRLPLMIKFIDAKENLSIQVHPGDKYARRHEKDYGKNEMWFILGAEEGAFIYLGFNRDVSREEVKRRIDDHSLEEILNKIYVHKDEAYYIPSGTVHAIGAGCLICEVQQTSNLTYRLYDYGRRDENGKTRELHIEKALDVLNYRRRVVDSIAERDTMSMKNYINGLIGRNEHCTLLNYDAEGELTFLLPEAKLTFALVIEGKGRIYAADESAQVTKGDTLMIHGRASRVSGKCKILFVAI